MKEFKEKNKSAKKSNRKFSFESFEIKSDSDLDNDKMIKSKFKEIFFRTLSKKLSENIKPNIKFNSQYQINSESESVKIKSSIKYSEPQKKF